MRLTNVLYLPPTFRYWKHFGAGYQRRQPNFKQWKYKWYAHFERRKIPDHTIPKDMLPPGAVVMEAEELLEGPIEAMPAELIRRKQENVIYDHPWPYNAKLDPVKNQRLSYCYELGSRFFRPREDCLVLTNTLLESSSLQAIPPFEPTDEHRSYLDREFDWITDKDSVMVRMPRQRGEWPKLNIRAPREYGVSKERKESNLLNIMSDYSQTLLAKYFHEQAQKDKLDEILSQRSLAHPHCQVPFERDTDKMLNFNLFIESMLISKSPLPLINSEPTRTKEIQPLDIRPRTWRSLLEQSRNYSTAWSFALPRNAHLHTIYLNSHIKRDHRDADEMLARCIVHAFGLTSQFARLRAISATSLSPDSPLSKSTDNQAGCILQDPLSVKQVNDKDLLDEPVVLQVISYDHARGQFDFLRYQLNTLKFDDANPSRVKNQAWHSGPITDLSEALRYYLDFQSFDASMVGRMRAVSEEAAGGGGGESIDGKSMGSLG